jgi:hypothetical protein
VNTALTLMEGTLDLLVSPGLWRLLGRLWWLAIPGVPVLVLVGRVARIPLWLLPLVPATGLVSTTATWVYLTTFVLPWGWFH